MSTATASFPIDLSAFKPIGLDPANDKLTDEQRADLQANIDLCRDAIIFFTACAAARGLGGHTGGPYDIVPEVLIADAFMRGTDKVVPIYWDEAGHRVAIQYLMSALNGDLEPERLTHYREYDSKLPGHPERDFTPGVKFSSGRLGHMWPYVNGVALANPGKAVVMFGSDGSQMEGDDAEAARLAVAQKLNVKLIIDDNDVTIAGYPSQYLPGYDVGRTLEGHGLPICRGDGEDLDDLYGRMARAFNADGPVALINKRKMAPKVPDIEGSNHGHDVIKVSSAIKYFEAKGRPDVIEALQAIKPEKKSFEYLGSSKESGKNRDSFGKVINEILDKMPEAERKERVVVIDSDLEGSCGLHHIHAKHPEVYISSGIMERGNLSAAAGFGYYHDKVGIMGTFGAFLEMCISEITMARLNESNLICHFSHSGCDDMADNTCHFGINHFFADGGIGEYDAATTRLYYPADEDQMRAIVTSTFNDKGVRFVFTQRSATPFILDTDGKRVYGDGYKFDATKDEVIREGTAGYIVSYGEMLYRSLDAVERLKADGIDVGLINKPTLNVIDTDMVKKVGKTGFVLVVESQNVKTGLGVRYGTWLLKAGLAPKYDHIGVNKVGNGGLWEHMPYQGLDPDSIIAKVRELA
ncbi:MAG: transketolase [Phycisphaera sp.]|nr:transketolase [Phycisphaera sp.]